MKRDYKHKVCRSKRLKKKKPDCVFIIAGRFNAIGRFRRMEPSASETREKIYDQFNLLTYWKTFPRSCEL